MLDTKSLNAIMKCLWNARFKWREIGTALNIDASTLEVIRQDNPYRTDDCFTAVVVEWLRNGVPAPCWKVLAEALSSPTVGVVIEEAEGNEHR